MQGMGINSHPGSTYGPVQDMDMGGHFEDMPPAPPQDNNQVWLHWNSFYLFDVWPLIFFRLLLGMTLISKIFLRTFVLVTDLPCPCNHKHFYLVDNLQFCYLYTQHLSWIFKTILYYVYKVSFLLLEKFNVCHKSELFSFIYSSKSAVRLEVATKLHFTFEAL